MTKTIKTALIFMLFCFPLPSIAFSVVGSKTSISSKRVVRIQGAIRPETAIRFVRELHATENEPGSRIIVITSPGGELESGEVMLRAIAEEKKKSNTKIICVADTIAHSMAFNILTVCDTRLMTKNTVSLVHKVAISALPFRGTAKNLRKEADFLDMLDEPYRQANAKAMSLTLNQYDFYADNETYWYPSRLLSVGYLSDIVKIIP